MTWGAIGSRNSSKGAGIRLGSRITLVVAVIAAAAASAGITFALDSDTSKKAPPKPGYLYAQDAHDGTLVRHGGPGEYDLTLYGVHPTALQFVDRPGNSVAAISVQQFLRRFFTAHGTIGAPPNAAINAVVPQRGNHQYLMGVTLLTARYDKARGILRYHVRALRQGARLAREHGRTDVVLPAVFGHVSVFIDDFIAGEGFVASETFGITGAEQEFVVPASINSVTITCNGAQGGTAYAGGSTQYDKQAISGGLGASVTATFAVTAGETLYIYVGGQGGPGTGIGANGGGGGGFNGGGGGGSATQAPVGGGAAGGGASEVRIGSDNVAGTSVVCGGGGGGGTAGGVGGAGGGPTGGDGEQVLYYGYPGVPGKGATQTAGGAGGPDATGTGGDGQDGSFGQGGSGGSDSGGGGGGGGGGYYGGGGGAADNLASDGPGGGGSSYVSTAGSSVSMSSGAAAGFGSVTIAEYSPEAIPIGPIGF